MIIDLSLLEFIEVDGLNIVNHDL